MPPLQMLTSHRFTLQKSRLAGFFLCLSLAGCEQPAVPPAGELAYQQAQTALTQQLPLKATELLELSIRQGNRAAVLLWIEQTRAHLGPLSQWQRLQQLGAAGLPAQAYQQLGLWRQVKAEQPQLPAIESANCQLQIQPVLASELAMQSWLQLHKAWPTSAFGQLPICFAAPVLFDSTELACSEHLGQRLQCNEQQLWPLASRSTARLLLVLAGRGGASYNNGLILLPENGSLALLQHELSHAFGFIDEYAYTGQRAERECQPGRLTANVLFSRDDIPAYLQKWQLSPHEVSLTAVATCGEQQAYKVVASTTHMQHYELAVPALYIRLIRQALKQPADILPVSYYFAVKARQIGAMQQWELLMRQAAAQDYAPAQAALGQGASSTAR